MNKFTESLFLFIAHQKAKPTFVNPNPWQNIIEIEDEKKLAESEKTKTQKIEIKKKAK